MKTIYSDPAYNALASVDAWAAASPVPAMFACIAAAVIAAAFVATLANRF